MVEYGQPGQISQTSLLAPFSSPPHRRQHPTARIHGLRVELQSFLDSSSIPRKTKRSQSLAMMPSKHEIKRCGGHGTIVQRAYLAWATLPQRAALLAYVQGPCYYVLLCRAALLRTSCYDYPSHTIPARTLLPL